MNTENKTTEKRIPVLVKKAERIKNTAVYIDGEIGEILEGNYNVGRIVKRIILEMRRELKDFQILVNQKIKKLKELKTDTQPVENKKNIKDKAQKPYLGPAQKTAPVEEAKKEIEISPDLKWLAEFLSLDMQDLNQKEIVKLIKEELAEWSEEDFEENASKKFGRIVAEFKLLPKKKEVIAEDEEEITPTKKAKKNSKSKTIKPEKVKSKTKKQEEDFEEDDEEESTEEGEDFDEGEGEEEGDDF